MEDPVAIPSSSSAAAAAVVPSPPPAPQQVPAPAVVRAAAAAPEPAAASRRQLFSVELRPGETTIVSWKKLQKEAVQAAPTSQPQPLAVVAAEPAVAAQLAPPGVAPAAENNPEDPAQPNRFNAVIEKIERLYMGKHSSDEEDLDDVPDDDQYDTDDSFIDDAELDEYFEVDNLKTKHSGFFVNKGTLEQIESGTSTDVAPKKRRSKDPSGDHIEINQGAAGDYFNISNMPGKATSPAHAGKKLATSGTGVSKKRSTDFATGVDAAKRTKISAYRDKGLSTQLDFQQEKTYSGENQDLANKIYHKEKHGTSDFSGITLPGTSCPTQAMHPITGRESAGTKPKGTRLERAIRDFEKFVAQYRPPAIDSNEVDPNGQASIKRRLPPEVKAKLAKVARLSTNHGKIQEQELMNRLMGIVGHLVQRRTLKRNMKDLVESGLSATQEKTDMLQRVKMEISEMVKEHVVAKAKVNEQQDGSADDFQAVPEEGRDLKGKFAMDSALEDRMCDLYDLYVEGMEEDKGPQSRKLYVELAELWPQGCMDKFGIKDAISRSKERKIKLHNQQKVRNEETLKRKRLAVAEKLPDSYPVVTQRAMALQVAHPSITNPSYPVTDYGQNQASRSLERAREASGGAVPDDSSKRVGEMKKKKRKPEYDLVDRQANPMKVPSQHGSEKQKATKHSDEANTITISTVLGLPFYDQQQI
ncbi:ubinuclein-1-like [Lolium rigidum]|uniref:ubinuclein-1-like n=1 Tax=Lolium rigidum TaxID=89674 RepID=UPI001F5E180D|nr:ubinuclein-1-like [Lolium rigidum]